MLLGLSHSAIIIIIHLGLTLLLLLRNKVGWHLLLTGMRAMRVLLHLLHLHLHLHRNNMLVVGSRNLLIHLDWNNLLLLTKHLLIKHGHLHGHWGPLRGNGLLVLVLHHVLLLLLY
jgi:hypothetical protein